MCDSKENDIQVSLFYLDKYIIIFKPCLKHETFKNEWNYGIIFHIDYDQYEIINGQIGFRLLINKNFNKWFSDSEWRDVPFHPGTFHLLPDGVTAKHNNDESMEQIIFGDYENGK